MQMRTDISKWGLANKRIVWLFTVLLTVGGVISYYRMPKLEDPEIVVRQALVVGLYPGASAHQVELELTTPLENSINQTSDILFTESYSYADMCYVMVTQDTKVPQDKLHSNWVKMRNNIADASLPQDAQVVVKDDFGSMSGLFYALKGDGVTPDRLQSFAEMICRELQKIEGVSNITVYGTQQQRVSVKLHQDRLNAIGGWMKFNSRSARSKRLLPEKSSCTAMSSAMEVMTEELWMMAVKTAPSRTSRMGFPIPARNV